MTDLLELALDNLVPTFADEQPNWADVLARAELPYRNRARRAYPLAICGAQRRRFIARRWRSVAVIAVAALVLVPSTVAFGGRLVGLLTSHGPQLPAAADRSQIRAVMDPRSGRLLAQAAPWKGHDGICYLVVNHSAGCIPRSPRGTLFLSGRFGQWGYTFDRRVVSATGIRRSGAAVPFRVVTFPAPLRFSLFMGGGPEIRTVELLGREGHVLYKADLALTG